MPIDLLRASVADSSSLATAESAVAAPRSHQHDGVPSIAAARAERSTAARTESYAAEIQRLLDAGLAVMQRLGTTATPRIADIVAESGLSNDAVYRHFTGKDDLLAAAIESGVDRLVGHLGDRMTAAGDQPDAQVRAWINTMLRQASDPTTAEAMRVVIWNAYRVSDGSRRNGVGRETIARLLVAPLEAMGSIDPERDALLVSYACTLRLEEFLWRGVGPTEDDIAHAVRFCTSAIASRETATDPDAPDPLGADASRHPRGDAPS